VSVLVLGTVSCGIHLSMLALFSMTAIFVSPYGRWLWNKPRRFENTAMAGLWLLAFLMWLSGAVGVPGASVDRFFALIYLTMAFAAAVYLRHLPRVRAWAEN